MKIKYKITSIVMSIMCAVTAFIGENNIILAVDEDITAEIADGDANGDGILNSEDVEYIMHYSIGDYKSIEDAADYNQDGIIDIYDACELYGSLIGAENSTEDLIKSPELSVGDFRIGQGKNVKTSLYLKNCNAKVGIIRESCELNRGMSTIKISDDIIMILSKDCLAFVNPKGLLIDQAIASLGFFATNGEEPGEIYDINFSFDILGNSDKEQCTPIIKNGSVTITDGTSTAFLRGDVNQNGKIDLYDAIEICKSIMGMREFTAEEKEIADFNNDGIVDLYDAIGIAKELLPK